MSVSESVSRGVTLHLIFSRSGRAWAKRRFAVYAYVPEHRPWHVSFPNAVHSPWSDPWACQSPRCWALGLAIYKQVFISVDLERQFIYFFHIHSSSRREVVKCQTIKCLITCCAMELHDECCFNTSVIVSECLFLFFKGLKLFRWARYPPLLCESDLTRKYVPNTWTTINHSHYRPALFSS